MALLVGSMSTAQADLWDKKHQAAVAVAAAQTDLQSSNAKVQRAVSQLASVHLQLPAARAAYALARGRLHDAWLQVQAVRSRLHQLQQKQAALQTQVADAQRQVVHTQWVMDSFVTQQYQMGGGLNEWAVVLAASSPSDFVQRIVTAQQVLVNQNDLVNQLTSQQAVLTAKQQELRVATAGMKRTQSKAVASLQHVRTLAVQARAAKQAVEALAGRRAQALTVARRQRSSVKQQYEAALREQARIQQAIQNAVSQSSGGGTATGALLWPVSGPMVQGVGWRVHPVYGYRSCHTGIDIAAAIGTPIHAAASGVVVWTNPADGGPYGNNTLVDDGSGLSTFYAHQSAFNVTAGQHVSKGQVIGYVGDTGWVTGPHLHFEVHINGVPYDPMGWFGGTKRPQSQFCPGS